MKIRILIVTLIGLAVASQCTLDMLIEAIKSGNFQDLKLGITKKMIRDNGALLLQQACSHGNMEIAKFLVGAGVLPFGGQANGILDAAVISGNMKLIYYLVKHGSDPRSLAKRTMSDILLEGDLKTVEYFYCHGYAFTSDSSDLLNSAVLSGSLEKVSFLMKLNLSIGINEYLASCQKAMQMGNVEMFDLLLSKFKAETLKILLELAITSGNQYMTKHITAYIASKEGLFSGSIWYELYNIAQKELRKDLAFIMVNNLNLTDLANCLQKLLYPTYDSEIDFPLLYSLERLPKVLADNPLITKQLLVLAIMYDESAIAHLVIECASAKGLCMCLGPLCNEEEFCYLEHFLRQSKAKEALLKSPDSAFSCFEFTFQKCSNIAEKILQLVDGTACSAQILAKVYEKGHLDEISFFLRHCPNIDDALRQCSDSADELFHLSREYEDKNMANLCLVGISGQLVFANLLCIWDMHDLSENDRLDQCIAFLNDVKNRAGYLVSLDLEFWAHEENREQLRLLLLRLEKPVYVSPQGNHLISQDVFRDVLMPRMFAQNSK